ncbi:MAG: hypothetical protein RIS29_1052 [Bacteroidota bacterium]|jgi:hypothetical protein
MLNILFFKHQNINQLCWCGAIVILLLFKYNNKITLKIGDDHLH